MNYLKAKFSSLHTQERTVFLTQEKSYQRYEIGIELWKEAEKYALENNMFLPYPDLLGMTSSDEYVTVSQDGECEYVSVEMIESNMFYDKSEFESFWDDLLDWISRGKIKA